MTLVTPASLDATRLAAAQMEHERLTRIRRAQAVVLRGSIERAERELATMRGVLAELESDDWIKPPTQMAAERAAQESHAA